MSYFGQSVENESLNTLVPIERFYPDLAPNTVSNATSESSSEPLFQGTRILYWYHPDYVSNVDLVTDVNGEAFELFLYNAWGESLHHWISNSSNSWSSPYRFNSKELDPETGMHYYGARYHHPKLSVWMSVDRLAHETFEPYQYTGNNPISLIDPVGEKVKGVTKQDIKQYKSDIHNILSDDKFSEVRKLIKVKGKSLASIDKSLWEAELDKIELSEDESAYLDLVIESVNSKPTHKIEYLRGDNASVEGSKAIVDHFNKLQEGTGEKLLVNGLVKSALISRLGGEGFNVPTAEGSHSFIASNLDKNIRSVTSAHEVIGHGKPSSIGADPAANNSHALQVDNLVRRILGLPARDGSDHGGYSEGHIVDPEGLPNLH